MTCFGRCSRLRVAGRDRPQSRRCCAWVGGHLFGHPYPWARFGDDVEVFSFFAVTSAVPDPDDGPIEPDSKKSVNRLSAPVTS
jgi:hypothetical protein